MMDDLLALQRLNIEIDALGRKARIEYPHQLKASMENEEKLSKAVANSKAKLQTLEMERRDLEGTLRLEEERMRKSRKKVNDLKKDYEIRAMQRELDGIKRGNSELEEQILGKMEEIDTVRKALDDLETHWQVASDEFAKIKGAVEAKVAELDVAIAEKEAQRKAAEGRVEPALLARYRRIRDRQHAEALVRVIGTSCQGCHMSVPHQIVNEMLRHRTIGSCPHCHRLIFVEAPIAAS